MLITDIATHRVGVLQGGGLSSLALALWLREQGVTTHQYVADIGQSTTEDLDALVTSLRSAGLPATVVDLRHRMAEVGLDLVRHQARHDGGYWNTTGASRLVLVEQLSPRLRDDGCTVLAHGCVGGGNDQRRFARYTRRLAPDLGVYAPWADPAALARFPDRTAMYQAVTGAGLWLDSGSDASRSTDANLAGVSHESATLEELTAPVDATTLSPRWSVWPERAPAEPETVTVTVDGGRIVDVAGSGGDPVAILDRAHRAGAAHGVWLRDVVERRIIGTCCRGVYEAPALEVLDVAWQRALQVGLDADSRALYDHLAGLLGAAVYEARHHDPVAEAARAGMAELIRRVTATVTLRLRAGGVTVAAVHVPGGETDRQTRFGTGGNRWREPLGTGSAG